MRDLTTYFRSNVSNESTNSHESVKDTNSVPDSLLVKSANKKRLYEDDSVPAQSKRKTAEVRRSARSRTVLNRESVEEDSSENEWNNKVNARKKSKRKSSIKKLDTSANSIGDEPEKPNSGPVTRILEGTVIKDCMNSPSTSHVSDRKRGGRKRRKSESDQFAPEHTDSSDDVFENSFKERPRRTYSKKSVTSETKEANNLFNYFAKAEKQSTTQSDNKLLDSPIDCMKKVQVFVQVHSPPRARPKKPKQSTTNELSPVVKLVRTRAVKKLNLDLIEVITTEDVSPPRTKSINKEELWPSSWEIESRSKLNEDEDDESAVFRNAGRATVSLKELTLEDSDPASENEKNDSFQTSDHTATKSNSAEMGCTILGTSCEDPIWRMRVQLAPKTASNSKPKKSKSRTSENSCYSEEEIEEKKSEKRNVEKTNQPKNKSEKPLKQPKLAPLFSKWNKKKSDCTFLVDDEARKSFLTSGLPEVVKKKFEEQKNVPIDEETFTNYEFPAITHVQQKNEHFVWNLPEIDLGLRAVEEYVSLPSCHRSFASFINTATEAVSDVAEKVEFDFKEEIATLKKLEPAVNVVDVYSSIKRLYKEAESTDSICWTDKYKPSTYGDLVGNTSNLVTLKEWIESHKRLKIVYSDCDSSSEEFVDSDDSSRNSRMKDNVAILAGPPGCGKTCAVYMLAKELGFEVLEVNAASNRDGKRLLDELLEATQSHRVKRTTIFEKAAKDKKSSRKKKKKRSEEEKRERKTMSLILIEDADILFENYDEGFLSALGTLARESKRPLVFIVNDINCPHLDKYKNNLILHFEYPSRSTINVWLKVIALTEGVKLSDAVLVDLFHVAGLDLRKSLLQLQMLISSKLCRSILDGERLFYQDWCRRVMQCHRQPTLPETEVEAENRDDDLFSPKKDATGVRKVLEEETRINETSQSDRERNRLQLNDHAKFMDIVTLLGRFESHQDENLHPCASDASHEDLLCVDICSLLKRKVFSDFSDSDSSVSFSEYYSLIRKNSRVRSAYRNTLANLQFPLLDRYAKYCDLLPALRTITRLEQPKQSSQQRRTNRYFSYLKSVNIDLNDQEMKLLRESMI